MRSKDYWVANGGFVIQQGSKRVPLTNFVASVTAWGHHPEKHQNVYYLEVTRSIGDVVRLGVTGYRFREMQWVADLGPSAFVAADVPCAERHAANAISLRSVGAKSITEMKEFEMLDFEVRKTLASWPNC